MKPRFFTLLFALAVAVGAVVLSYRAVQTTSQTLLVSGQSRNDFLNTRWGMTPSEVERAGGMALVPASDSLKLYNVAASDPEHYLSYEQRGVKFLGREAKAVYTFRDGRLFACHLFVSDPEGEALDRDMRRYLTRVFGESASLPEDEQTLKLIWQFNDRIVNYWFMEEDLSLRPKYTAVFGITKVNDH